MTDESYYHPVPIVCQHITSRASLVGRATSFDSATKTLYISFDCTDAYKFSAVTGYGKEAKSRAWRVSEASLRVLFGDDTVRRERVARRRVAKKRAGKPGDPRQVTIGE